MHARRTWRGRLHGQSPSTCKPDTIVRMPSGASGGSLRKAQCTIHNAQCRWGMSFLSGRNAVPFQVEIRWSGVGAAAAKQVRGLRRRSSRESPAPSQPGFPCPGGAMADRFVATVRIPHLRRQSWGATGTRPREPTLSRGRDIMSEDAEGVRRGTLRLIELCTRAPWAPVGRV